MFRWTKIRPPLENEARLEAVPGSRELRGRDEWQLRHLLDAAPGDFAVSLDLTELDGITEDGCQAPRNFGAAVVLQRRRCRILYPLGAEVAEALRETGPSTSSVRVRRGTGPRSSAEAAFEPLPQQRRQASLPCRRPHPTSSPSVSLEK